MKKLKICMIGEFATASWNGSATQKVILNLSENLSANGNVIIGVEKVKGSGIKSAFQFYKFTEKDGYRIVSGGYFPLLFFLLTNSFDITFINIIRKYQLLWFPFIFLKKTVRSVIFHDILDFLQKDNSNNHKRNNYFLKKLYLKYFDTVFVLNLSDKRKLQSLVNRKNIFVANNGVDTKKYSRTEISRNEKLIINSSGLGHPNKGLDFMESSLKKVKCEYDFQIIGKNPFGLTHPNFKGELNESEYIGLLNEAKIVVVSSYYDSFSMVALEAMAFGVPIIITENCGISERLTNGVGCFIIKYNDEKALAEKIILLLEDNILWQKMSNDAVSTSQKFNWETIALEYEECFRNIINKNEYTLPGF